MKLKVALNSKSINALISQLNEIKTTILPNMIEHFLTRCCEEIKIKANKNLETSGLGADVISEIQGQWSISVKGKNALLRNGEGRGYMVEFGVGEIGENNPHPKADLTYAYNIPTDYKDQYGQWRFRVDSTQEIDLAVGFYKIVEINEYETGESKLTIKTKGSPPIMFLYNALLDFKTEKLYEKLWRETKIKFIR